jgi:hypothetical protein
MKAAALPVYGPRIPVLRQLSLEQAIDLRPKRGGVFCECRLLGPSWVNAEAKTYGNDKMSERYPEHAVDLPGEQGAREDRSAPVS